MFIVHVYVHVKPDRVEDFRHATVENAAASLLRERGVARFAVCRQSDDPTRFVLVEAYRTEEATAKHKETDHYKKWKELVEPMMAEPRRSVKLSNIFPDDEGW